LPLNFSYINVGRAHYEYEKFSCRSIRACCVGWVCCTCIFAAISTTIRASKKSIETLVDKAAAKVNSEGRAAFSDF